LGFSTFTWACPSERASDHISVISRLEAVSLMLRAPEATVRGLIAMITAAMALPGIVRPHLSSDALYLSYSGRRLEDEDIVQSIGIQPGEFLEVWWPVGTEGVFPLHNAPTA
jgi:hypothetical protein